VSNKQQAWFSGAVTVQTRTCKPHILCIVYFHGSYLSAERDPAAIVYLFRVMFQDAGHRLLTAHSWVRSETSSYDIYFGHSGSRTGFFSENFGLYIDIQARQIA
jgi:hypothetical protein